MLINLSAAYGAGSALKPMPEQNYVLWSEDLSNAVYSKTRLETVADSGIATPEIDGQTFGNYWEITPNTTNSTHLISQASISFSEPAGVATFLVAANGYNNVNFRISGAALIAFLSFDIAANEFWQSVGFDSVAAEDNGVGDYLITAKWSGKPSVTTIQAFVYDDSRSNSFAGNGTNGILMSRVDISQPNRRYVKTTDSAVL